MKKFALNLFSFFLFSFVFYLIALLVWGSYAPQLLKPNLDYRVGSNGHMFSRLAEVKKTKDVDILFLGSSHTYRGFDTRIFSKAEWKSFNLGSSSQTPLQTSVLLDRYLAQLNPKTVIYEVYPETFIIDGVESSLGLIANDKNDWYSFKMTLKINNIKTYNTFLYGSMRDLFILNKSYHEPVMKDNDTYIPGGFVQRDIDYYKPIDFDKTKISINKKQLESFHQIIALLKRKDIDVILVYAPISTAKYKSYSNNLYFDSIMESYSEYYNFNEMIHLNDSTDFYDADHMNQFGVEKFNIKLIEILNKR